MKAYRCVFGGGEGLKYLAFGWEGHILDIPTNLFFIPKHQQAFGLF